MELNKFTKLEKSLSKLGGKLKPMPHKIVALTEYKSELREELGTTGKYNNRGNIICKNGLLEFDGEQVVIYIKDHNSGFRTKKEKGFVSSIESYVRDSGSLNKFHLCDCEVIEEMKSEDETLSKGRFERYVASQRKDGLFEINLQGEKYDVKLYPCRKCLEKWNKIFSSISYNEQEEIIKNFDLEKFFKFSKTKFKIKPKYSDKTFPNTEFDPNIWKKQSRNYRESKRYTCEKCELDLNNFKWLLDAHHINGITTDNKPSNLKALCKTCHRKEPMHDHMTRKHDEIIARLRKEQNLIDPDPD